MNRIIMISDIHGCIREFNQLLDKMAYNSMDDQLVLLGDYVDRGTSSKEVVERVMELVDEHHAIALRGNHDQRFVDLMKNDSHEIRLKFKEHGGIATLQSYCAIEQEMTVDEIDKAIEHIQLNCSSHIDFLRSLPLYYEDNDHIYVHAGINPKFSDWKYQPDHDFMYIKHEFISSNLTLTKKVVFGHTITKDIHGRSDIWFGADKIGIDGGCAYGMQLNALIFQDGIYTTEHIKKM